MKIFVDKHFDKLLMTGILILIGIAFIFDPKQSHEEVLKLALSGAFSSLVTLLTKKGTSSQDVNIDSEKTNVISDESVQKLTTEEGEKQSV